MGVTYPGLPIASKLPHYFIKRPIRVLKCTTNLVSNWSNCFQRVKLLGLKASDLQMTQFFLGQSQQMEKIDR